VLSNPKGASNEKDLKLTFRKELLLVAGCSQKEIDSIDLSAISDEDLNAKIRQGLLGVMTNNGAEQKIAAVNEVEKHLAQGWEHVATLPNRKAVLKLPT